MLKPIVSLLLLASATVCAAQPVLTAAQYAQQLGVGMDVDWARTDRGIREFDPLVVREKIPVPVTKKRWLTGGWRWRITLVKARRCWVST